MPNLFKGVVKLTEDQYKTLLQGGSFEVDGQTINYDENTLYVTDYSIDGELNINSLNPVSNKAIATAIENLREISTSNGVTIDTKQDISGDKNFTGAVTKNGVDLATVEQVPVVSDSLNVQYRDNALSVNQGIILNDKITTLMENVNGRVQSFSIANLEELGTLFNIDTSEVKDEYAVGSETITYKDKEYTLKTGDIFLIVDVSVPDYWFSLDDMKLFKLETSKVDLTKYVDTETDQTIGGNKTFSNQIYAPKGIKVGDSGDSANNDFGIVFGDTNSKIGANSNGLFGFYSNYDFVFRPKVSYDGKNGVRLTDTVLQPDINNKLSLGTNDLKFKDLYLSGNLSDGTNSIAIKDIANKSSLEGLATEEYVRENGGKIDKIKVNGVEQTITDKVANLVIDIPEPEVITDYYKVKNKLSAVDLNTVVVPGNYGVVKDCGNMPIAENGTLFVGNYDNNQYAQQIFVAGNNTMYIRSSTSIDNSTWSSWELLAKDSKFAQYVSLEDNVYKFAKDEFNKSSNLYYGTNKIGGIDASTGEMTTATNRISTGEWYQVKPNTKYSISITGLQDIAYTIHKSDKTLIKDSNWNGSTSITITTTAETYYIRMVFRYTDNRTISSVSELTSVMFNEGDPLPYQSYNGEIVHKTDLSSYLPLSGGTLTGDLIIDGATSIDSRYRATLKQISSNDNPTDLIMGSNGTGKWSMTCRNSAESYNLGIYNYGLASFAATIDYNTNAFVFSKTPNVNGTNVALTSDLSKYLPLSGGTMTGQINAPQGIKVGVAANAYNNVGILFGDAGARIGVNSESGIFGLYSNNEIFIRPYYSTDANNGVKLHADAFYPSINGKVDLGTSTYKFKDLYLTGGATMNGALNLNGSYPQITTTTADFIIQTSGGKQYDFTDTELRPVQTDADKLSIGRSDRRFKDLYLSGTAYVNKLESSSGLIVNSPDASSVSFKRTNAGEGSFLTFYAANQTAKYSMIGAWSDHNFGLHFDGDTAKSIQISRNRELIKDNQYTYTLPNKTGTVALTSDLSNYTSFMKCGSTSDTKYYTMFARTSSSNATGNVGATMLVSGVGQFGGTQTGTWLVEVSNRGSNPTMKVKCLNANNSGTVTFGYYIDSTNGYFYFGVYCPSYRGDIAITILRNTSVTIQDFGDSTTAPSGWTTISTENFVTSSESVASATKATQDGNGNVITNSYVASVSRSQVAISNPTTNMIAYSLDFKSKAGTSLNSYVYNTYLEATTSLNGLMTAADKTKLNNLSNMVTLTQAQYDALATKDANTYYFIKEE